MQHVLLERTPLAERRAAVLAAQQSMGVGVHSRFLGSAGCSKGDGMRYQVLGDSKGHTIRLWLAWRWKA